MRATDGGAILTWGHTHQFLEDCGEMGLMRKTCLQRNFDYRHIAVAQAIPSKLYTRLPHEFSNRQPVVFSELPCHMYFVHSRFYRQLRQSGWVHEIAQ
jgi:hypothetical protein